MLVLFGGTFDPVHVGHIALANCLATTFSNSVTFMPTGRQLYKTMANATDIQRMEMLRLVIGGDPRFIIDETEISSVDACYSFKTLSLLRQRIGSSEPLFFLLGADSLVSLDQWEEWQSLLKLTNFVVALRPGFDLTQMSVTLAQFYSQHLVKQLDISRACGQIWLLDFEELEISSTKIRCLRGKKQSILGLVPPAVEQYIIQQKMYE